MSGRQTYRTQCKHQGCSETAFYADLAVADRSRLARQFAETPWRCLRHSQPNSVLARDNLSVTTVITAEESRRFPNLAGKLFWREEGAADVGSGFTSGPGFRAWADDFPKGSRVVITATVELPITTPTQTDERGSHE